MDIKEEAILKHTEWKGKIEVITRAPVASKHDLSVAYTPGVAEPCLEISKDVDLSYKYTRDRKPVCRLWKVSAHCLRLSVM